MEKFLALIRVLRVGGAVANPKLWIAGGITVTILAPALAALAQAARAWGINVPLDDSSINDVAGAIVVLANVLLPLACHKHVGVLPAAANSGAVDAAPAAVPAATPVSPFNDSTGA